MASLDRFSDLRVLRFADRIDGILHGERLGPIRAGIDLTNLCQDRCSWCEPLDFRKASIQDNRHTLDTGTAFELIEQLAAMDCKTINFSGGGEPTLHRDFGPLLRYAHRKGIRTWIVTNGGFLEKWCGDLLTCADHIRVSLDASNATEHETMHGRPDEFVGITAQIEALSKARQGKRSPEIGIGYIVANCNSSLESLTRVMDWAYNAGVDFIHFRPISEEKHEWLTEDWDAIAARVQALAEKYPPTFQIFPLGKRKSDVFSQRNFKHCYAALSLAVISATGDVVACCDERTKIFGNLYRQSFKEIWLSARHRLLAEKIVPQFCPRCLMCGTNTAIEKFIVGNEALPELL